MINIHTYFGVTFTVNCMYSTVGFFESYLVLANSAGQPGIY